MVDKSEGFTEKSLKRAVEGIEVEIKATTKELEKEISKDEEIEKKSVLLETIPGIGRSTAIMLLSGLRELGKLKKTEIAALSGLAPVNNDSGGHKGKRSIRGGRHEVRALLYMPILGAATQHNPRLKEFYERLVESGKPKKVALTACMLKLVVWANAILKTGEPWVEKIT